VNLFRISGKGLASNERWRDADVVRTPLMATGMLAGSKGILVPDSDRDWRPMQATSSQGGRSSQARRAAVKRGLAKGSYRAPGFQYRLRWSTAAGRGGQARP
jgi:hypothetical protein